MLVYCLFEHFPYHPLPPDDHDLAPRGIWEYLRGDLTWHQVKRTGASTSAAPGVPKFFFGHCNKPPCPTSLLVKENQEEA